MLNRLLWRSQHSRGPAVGWLIALAVVQIAFASIAPSSASASEDVIPDSGIVLTHSNTEGPAEVGTRESQPLEPRYQPREPKEEGWYNDSYIFGMTRDLANSTIAPAGKAPLFLFTIPLDIVLLPFTVIGGFFG